MANWARLQEQLTGLPVVKRDKHSIHFDKGNGEIVANFSGKPCHYEENGIWKALDTAIVELEDGSLGAKGVPVRLNLNGLVRIINEQNEDLYSQVTTRVGVFNSTTSNLVDYINLPVGTVQDDLLVKDTDLYSHTLRLTETGLREEIVIHEKPAFITDKANLWLVLDTVVTGITFEDGWLDQFEIAQMHFPPPTATDAEGREGTAKCYAKNINGVQHIFTGLKFSELYRAAYPVTIDPDFTGTSSGGDTNIRSANSTNYGTDGTFQFLNNRHILIRFDLSSVPAGASITAGAIRFNATAGWNATGMTMNEISDANGDWGETTCSWLYKVNATTTGWAGSAGLSTSGTDYETTEFIGSSSTTYQGEYSNFRCDIVVSSGGLSAMEGWCGQASNNGLIFRTTATGYTFVASKEHATEYFRPLLSVTYTAGSTGVPKHFLHYARLRSN